MLSSLGAHRERSPSGHQPPLKVFIQEEVSKPETQHQTQPMIVVQDYQEKTSQSQEPTKPHLGKELVEDLSYKLEAHAEPQILPDVKPDGAHLGAVALGEPKRQKIGNDNETMESQQYHLDVKPTPEKIKQACSMHQTFTLQQEPKQPQIQVNTQQQTQDHQKQVQIQKECTSQQKTLLQQSVKVRKSQKCAENRPWLQQKAQAEVLVSGQVRKVSSEVVPQTKAIATALPQPPICTSEPIKEQVTWTQQQQPITMTSVASQAQDSTRDQADQAETNSVTQTNAYMNQAQQQQSALQTTMIQAKQQEQHMAVNATVASQPVKSAVHPIQVEPKNVLQTQFHVTEVQPLQSVMQPKMCETQQVTQTRVVQVQQNEPITQVKLGQVHQQPPVPQMLPKELIPAVLPITSQKQPEALTMQKHLQSFPATEFTQPPTKLSEMQPPVMTQVQRPAMPQPQSLIMSQTCQYLPVTGEDCQIMRQPSTLIQPQLITQRYTFAAQSPPQQSEPVRQSQGISMPTALPKSTASVQPRIITMPQNQPQFHKLPQSPPQVMVIDKTHDNIQLRPQSHIQKPQWKPITPDIMTHSYHETPHQGFMPSHMLTQHPFQSQGHLQTQGVTQTSAQPQQWAPLGGGLGTQTYTSVQGTGNMQPYTQSQGYPSSQPQSQHCGQFSAESILPPYSQICPQSSVQSHVTSQHWQPLRQSDMVRHSYSQAQMSEYPHAQHKVTPRPQSTPQQWPLQPEPQSQAQFLKMFPQPMAQTPWVQASSHTTVRPQGPAPQQPQNQQQQWPQNRPEVEFQILQPQLPQQEQPQQKFSGQVRPPGLAPLILQGPAQQQPQNQQLQWPQNRAEAPFQVQLQGQTLQTQPQVQALQNLQSPLHDQSQPHLVAEIKSPSQAGVPLQANSETYAKAQALARTKFEDAKHCLQVHIIDAINIFMGKKIMHKQVHFKEVD